MSILTLQRHTRRNPGKQKSRTKEINSVCGGEHADLDGSVAEPVIYYIINGKQRINRGEQVTVLTLYHLLTQTCGKHIGIQV